MARIRSEGEGEMSDGRNRAERWPAMAQPRRSSREMTLEATVRLGDGMGSKREARRTHHDAFHGRRRHGGDAWLGGADDEHDG